MRPFPWVRTIPVMAVAIVMLATHPGWRIADLTNVLDPSWAAVLNKAWVERWQFGSDIVFTFGPYGFLFTEYIPTFTLRLAITTCMAVLFVAGLFRILFTSTKSPLLASVVALMFWDASKSIFADSWFQLLAILPCLLIWTATPVGEELAVSRRMQIDDCCYILMIVSTDRRQS
jgi:hypothetical protein